MLTLAFHTVPESPPKRQCNPSKRLCMSHKTLFPGSYSFVLDGFLLWEYDGGVYLERMLSLRNHGTPRGAVRRQWAMLVWD